MQINHSLRIETSQKLTITPQLCQAIAILQLSSLELSAMVEKELLENPVLEADEQEVSPSGKGIRIFVKGTLPEDGRKVGKVEMYQNKRYLTVTGRPLPGRG